MELYSKVFGKGQPLLILHGFLGYGDNWKTLGKQFADSGFEVHLIDQRNHGRSPHSEDFSYELMAADIKSYCVKHNLSKVLLLGHSMGGKTAMLTATKFPELVEKLIVADIAPKHYPQHHQQILKGLSSLNFEELQSRTEADEHLANYISEWGVRQFLLKNLYWVNKGQLGFRMNLTALIDNIEQVGEALPQDAIFTKDTLFINGGESDYIKPSDKDLIVQHFPMASIHTISGAGHWLHAEKPEEFYNAVISFARDE